MTEPDQQPDMPVALRLSVAIDQLIQPGIAHLDRAQAETTPEVAAVAARADHDHAERMAVLRRSHAAALQGRAKAGARDDRMAVGRNTATMRRVLAVLIAQEQAHRARAEARAVATATLPSLLDQLHDAVESSQGTGSGSAGASRSPIGLNAAELLGHIQRTTMHRGGGTLAQHLRAWSEHHDRTDADAQAAEQWVGDARAVVAPDRGFELGGACPLCHTRRVWVQDGDERVLKAALQVSYATRSARCIAPGCTGRWPKEGLCSERCFRSDTPG